MKRILSIAALTALMLAGTAGTANARSWRVNNNAAKAPHFTSINAACSSEDVQAGDTLYLDPDLYLTSDQTISKTLTVIGPGYFLTNLPFGSAILGKLIISAANCKIEGCVMTGNVGINAQNVTIERCKVDNSTINIGGTGGNGSNTVIRQCYLKKINGYGQTNNNSAHCIIENCFFVRPVDNAIISLYYPIIRNNSILFDYSNSSCWPISGIANGQIYNNIIIRKDGYPNNLLYPTLENCDVYNNVLSCSGSTYPAYPQNKCLNSKDASLVWKLTGANEAQYQLKDESPADGYATDGGECGAFGGLFPYVLSGHPVGMPYFESTNTPTRSINGQVKITQHVKLQTN